MIHQQSELKWTLILMQLSLSWEELHSRGPWRSSGGLDHLAGSSWDWLPLLYFLFNGQSLQASEVDPSHLTGDTGYHDKTLARAFFFLVDTQSSGPIPEEPFPISLAFLKNVVCSASSSVPCDLCISRGVGRILKGAFPPAKWGLLHMCNKNVRTLHAC